jgi:hypothetical protein
MPHHGYQTTATSNCTTWGVSVVIRCWTTLDKGCWKADVRHVTCHELGSCNILPVPTNGIDLGHRWVMDDIAPESSWSTRTGVYQSHTTTWGMVRAVLETQVVGCCIYMFSKRLLDTQVVGCSIADDRNGCWTLSR